MRISLTKKQYISLSSVATMLIVWKITALWFDSPLILPHPEAAFVTVLKLITEADFIKTVGLTVLRGVSGFVISAILGVIVGIPAGISTGFNAFINPIIVSVRSIPVISLILLALIWFNPDIVPVFIAILTMFPFICTNVADGIKSVDKNLIEMAIFYKVGWRRIIEELYLPAIMPFIISGASSAMGIGWRAIIIGEVLSQPQFGIGTRMQAAQSYLLVESVIAWTIIAVVISYVFEKTIRWCERKIVKWRD